MCPSRRSSVEREEGQHLDAMGVGCALCLGQASLQCVDIYLALHYSGGMDVTDNWTTQLRKGVLELCILNVVGRSPVYGYDIVKRLRGIDALVIREGTVYPILSRLRRDGLVSTTLRESPEGPARKYYELTERGRQVCGEMNAYWDLMKRGIDRLKQETPS